MSSLDIIKRSCLFFGSTFDGRKKFSVDLLNANYKLPIVIEESTQLIFFQLRQILVIIVFGFLIIIMSIMKKMIVEQVL